MVCGFLFHTQYNFRDLSEIIVQRYLLCLIDCKVKAVFGCQNLHTYGQCFVAKPCINVHNTFSRHIISNKSRTYRVTNLQSAGKFQQLKCSINGVMYIVEYRWNLVGEEQSAHKTTIAHPARIVIFHQVYQEISDCDVLLVPKYLSTL